jgi:predicted O-methyltransferase YrrM
MEVAKAYVHKAGLQDVVQLKLGPALDSLNEIALEQQRSFDLAFIDADKRAYRTYYEQLLKLIRPGGLILVDNVLWYGKVADQNVDDAATVALRKFNAFLLKDDRIDFNIIPVGDGIAMCRVKE